MAANQPCEPCLLKNFSCNCQLMDYLHYEMNPAGSVVLVKLLFLTRTNNDCITGTQIAYISLLPWKSAGQCPLKGLVSLKGSSNFGLGVVYRLQRPYWKHVAGGEGTEKKQDMFELLSSPYGHSPSATPVSQCIIQISNSMVSFMSLYVL